MEERYFNDTRYDQHRYFQQRYIDKQDKIEAAARALIALTAPDVLVSTPSPALAQESEKKREKEIDADLAFVLKMAAWTSDVTDEHCTPYAAAIVAACVERGIHFSIRQCSEGMMIAVDADDARVPAMTDAHGVLWRREKWGLVAVATPALRLTMSLNKSEYAVHAELGPLVFWAGATGKVSELDAFRAKMDDVRWKFERGAQQEATRNGAAAPPASPAVLSAANILDTERSNFAALVGEVYAANPAGGRLVLAPLGDPQNDMLYTALRESGWRADSMPGVFARAHIVRSSTNISDIFDTLGMVEFVLVLLHIPFVCGVVWSAAQKHVAASIGLALLLVALDVAMYLVVQLYVARHAKTLVVRS